MPIACLRFFVQRFYLLLTDTCIHYTCMLWKNLAIGHSCGSSCFVADSTAALTLPKRRMVAVRPSLLLMDSDH